MVVNLYIYFVWVFGGGGEEIFLQYWIVGVQQCQLVVLFKQIWQCFKYQVQFFLVGKMVDDGK